jgi:hypothetical protein
LNITSNRLTGDTEQVEVNQADPGTGAITNDLTLGEFDVIVSNTPARETLEDSQFDQAMALKEAGVQISDEVLIENSRLNKRSDIIKQMREAETGEEAQMRKELEQKAAELELAKQEAEIRGEEAAASLKQQQAEFMQSVREFNVKMEQNNLEFDQKITQDQEAHDLAMKHKDEQNEAALAAKKAAAAAAAKAKPPSKPGAK